MTDLRPAAYASIGAVEREIITDDLLDYANQLDPALRQGATLVILRFMRQCRAEHKDKTRGEKKTKKVEVG